MADISLSFAIGALVTLAFESPILIFEKIIFGSGGRRKVNSTTGRENYNSYPVTREKGEAQIDQIQNASV